MNLLNFTGTLHGDRANYAVISSGQSRYWFDFSTCKCLAVNDELMIIAVCDEGTWVHMDDGCNFFSKKIEYFNHILVNDFCAAIPFEFGHFSKDKFAIGESMGFTCDKVVIIRNFFK